MRRWWFARGHLFGPIAAVALLFALLGVQLYGAVEATRQDDAQRQLVATAGTIARGIAVAVSNGEQVATAAAAVDGTADLVRRLATDPTISAVEYADLNMQRANPWVTGFYYYDRRGTFILAQVVNPSHRPPTRLGISCDASSTYCTDTNSPSASYLAGADLRASLAALFQRGVQPRPVLSVEGTGGLSAALYIIEPIRSGQHSEVQGALVERLDAAGSFAPYVPAAAQGSQSDRGTALTGSGLVAADAWRLGPAAPLDPRLARSIGSGWRASTNGHSQQRRFAWDGVTMVAGAAPITGTDLLIVSFAPAATLPAPSILELAGICLLCLLLASGVVSVAVLGRRLRLARPGEVSQAITRAERTDKAPSSAMQPSDPPKEGELVMAVSSLAAAQEHAAPLWSEGHDEQRKLMVEILHASQAVHGGAALVDDGLRRLADVTTSQNGAVTTALAGMVEAAQAVWRLRQTTAVASSSAAQSQAVTSTVQAAAWRCDGALTAIGQAASDTSRNCTRLQDDARRLQGLFAAIRRNAERLEQQGAGSRGAESHLSDAGTAYIRTIGWQARLAEGAVDNLMSSLDELTWRMERLTERVHTGTQELRTVGSTLEELGRANGKLRQAMARLDDATSLEARAAQRAAYAISEVALLFEQLTELVLFSNDEMRTLRLRTLGLLESIVELKAA